MPVGKGGSGTFGISHRFAAAFEAMSKRIKDEHGEEMESEIEAAVGKIEAFVADRKIRDGGSAQSESEAGPVVERRIDYFVAAEAAVGVGEGDVADFPAPTFDESHGERVGGGRIEFTVENVLRGGGELIAQISAGALNFQRTHAGPGEDIAAGPDRDGRLREAMPAGGVIVADIAHQAAGAGGEADEAGLSGLGRGDRADIFKTGANRSGIPEPGGGLFDVSEGGV